MPETISAHDCPEKSNVTNDQKHVSMYCEATGPEVTLGSDLYTVSHATSMAKVSDIQ